MLNKDQRLFFSSFLITLLLSGWVAVFLIVDASSSRFAHSGTTPAIALDQSEGFDYTIDLLGREYYFTLAPFNESELWRKEHASLVTPRKVLLAEQAYSLSVYAGRKLYDRYKEWQYQQNIANEPAN